MFRLSLVTFSLFFGGWVSAQVWTTRSASVRLFSEAPMENIEATNQKGSAAFNTTNSKVFARIPIKSFVFPNGLMQEHFNENYMESDKFPNAEFDGAFQGMPDLSKDGTYQVNLVGKLTVHGVTRERTLDVTLKVVGGVITAKSQFKVRCVDHKIEIPSLVVKNIAEEIDITLNCEFVPKAK